MVEVKSVRFVAQDAERVRFIRNSVFTGEQNVDAALDFDGNDSQAIHALVIVDGKAVGTGRMLDDGHIGRVAILKDYRGQGHGRNVIACLVEQAQQQQYPRVYLGSQLHAIEFYRNLGFTPYGEQYVEANMEHISMEKCLKK